MVRLTDRLDDGQELVWSLTIDVTREHRAFDALQAVASRAQSQAEARQGELCDAASLPCITLLIFRELVAALAPDKRLRYAQAEVLAARRHLGRVRW
jgi:hypothetical protein